jgi:hypothetical protein
MVKTIIMKKRIIYIPELQYECYFLGSSWKIIHTGNVKIIYPDSFYAYPFYIIFENIETASNQLTDLISKYNILLLDIFPIELIVKYIVEHQQGYWLNLCINFIIKMDCLNENIAKTLAETKHNKKRFDQELRHRIRKIMLLSGMILLTL